MKNIFWLVLIVTNIAAVQSVRAETINVLETRGYNVCMKSDMDEVCKSVHGRNYTRAIENSAKPRLIKLLEGTGSLWGGPVVTDGFRYEVARGECWVITSEPMRHLKYHGKMLSTIDCE